MRHSVIVIYCLTCDLHPCYSRFYVVSCTLCYRHARPWVLPSLQPCATGRSSLRPLLPVLFPACPPFVFREFDNRILRCQSLRNPFDPGFVGFQGAVFWTRERSLLVLICLHTLTPRQRGSGCKEELMRIIV